MSSFRSKLKKAVALSLTALTASAGVSCLPNTVVNAQTANTLSNADRGVIFASSRTDFRDESIYFVITTRFYDGDSSNNARTSEDTKAKNPENDPSWRGDFKGLIDKLDYIKALGFTAIWITPVVENNSGYDYHGYHAYDFSAVDKRYESNGVTYQTLIDACHAKGMKVIQDIVLNHTCNWGERNLLQLNSEVYTERNKAVMDGSNDPENIYHHRGFCGGGDWDNYNVQVMTLHDDCFDLETENPKVYNYLTQCYTNYINMGVDAFRIDTVKHLSRLTLNSVFIPAFKQAGGDKFYMFGEVCTKGHDVWYRGNPPISTCFYTWAEDDKWANCWTTDLATNEKLVEDHYKAHSDTNSQPTSTNAFLNGNEYHTPDYSMKSGLDSIDFQMHWSFNDAGSAFYTALGEDKYFNDSTWNVVYVDSHDYGPDQNQTLRYNGGTDAWAENLSLLFTFRGIPCVYYGSEIEFQAGMPIDVGPNAPLSETGRAYYGDHIEGEIATTDFTVMSKESGAVKSTLDSPLSQHIIRLNRLRQAIPALRKGQYSTENCSSNGGMAFKKRYTDSSTDSFVCVAISSGATFSGIPNGTYVDAVTGDTQTVSGGTLTANVSGRGNMAVYVLSTAKTPAPGRVIPDGAYLGNTSNAQIIGVEGTDVPTPVVDVTGVTVSKSSVTVKTGETVTVNATVTPSNATNKSIKWTSSNTSVATVSNGTVKAVAKGTATITATSANGKTATATVTVTESSALANNSTLSAISIAFGDTVTATGKASGGTGSYQYQVVYKKSSDSKWTTAQAYKANSTVTFKPASMTKYDVCVKVKDSAGTEVKKFFTVTVGSSPYPTVAMSISATQINLGETVTAKATASSGTYKFAFLYKQKAQSNWTTAKDFSSATSAVIKPAKATTYNICIKAKDSSGNIQKKYFELTVVNKLTNTSKISSTTLTIGKPITINCSATGGTGYYNYAVLYKKASQSNWTTVQGFKSNDIVKITPASASTYEICVKVKDTNGTIEKKFFSIKTTSGELTNNSKISATSITLGNSVTLTGAASGGSGSYKYAVYYKSSSASTWNTKQEFNANNSTSIKFSGKGSKEVCIKVKDSAGTVAKKYFTVTVK